jgi:CBS domain-containing protein
MHEERAVQIKEIMTRDPVVSRPDATLREAAQTMRELDSGVLPIGEDDRLLGILTDRDITIRATAEGKDPNSTPVREVMSSEVVACFEDDDEQDAAAKMQEHQLRRLVVLDRNERLVGIVSMGDLALYTTDDRLAGEVTEAVSEPTDAER